MARPPLWPGRAGPGVPCLVGAGGPQVLSLQRGPGRSGRGSGPARKCRLHWLPGAPPVPSAPPKWNVWSAVTSTARAAVTRGPHRTVGRARPQRLGLAGCPRVSLLLRPQCSPPRPVAQVLPALTPHAREAGVIEGVEMCLSGTAQLRASAGRFVCWGSCWPRDLRPALPPLGGTVHQRTRGRALHAATPHRLLAVPLSITPFDPWGN